MDAFRFLGREDLTENFRRAVERSPRGMIDWSRVWGVSGIGYTELLQRVSQMLHRTHRPQTGRRIDDFQRRAGEIRENRERVMRRYPQPDQGHIHVRNSWPQLVLCGDCNGFSRCFWSRGPLRWRGNTSGSGMASYPWRSFGRIIAIFECCTKNGNTNC